MKFGSPPGSWAPGVVESASVDACWRVPVNSREVRPDGQGAGRVGAARVQPTPDPAAGAVARRVGGLHDLHRLEVAEARVRIADAEDYGDLARHPTGLFRPTIAG